MTPSHILALMFFGGIGAFALIVMFVSMTEQAED